MTSSIFLPRMSRAWPEPSTHLTASTMFVLPEPFGPTMAVTPPSNWISVCRAKVLKPSNCRDLRNKLAGRLADVGGNCPWPTTGAHSIARAVVDGRLAESLLRHLLQPALEVLIAQRRGQRAIAIEVVVVCRVVTRIEEDGAEHRLERVGEQRLEVPASSFRDALAEVEVAAEVELLGKLGQRVGVDHRRTRLRQLAFGGARVMLVQILGADQLQHRVAEVFEPFVVARRDGWIFIRERAVRDSLEKEARVAKVDPDLLLKELQRLRERWDAARVLRLCYEPAFSWMYSQACPTVVIFSASSSGISRPVFSSKA